MPFRWAPNKAAANLKKHGINFADAVGVFEDARALTMSDPHAHEERFVTLGFDAIARLLVVIWTPRDGDIRLISARKANRAERRQYEEES